jgi:hypothetical protein
MQAHWKSEAKYMLLEQKGRKARDILLHTPPFPKQCIWKYNRHICYL